MNPTLPLVDPVPLPGPVWLFQVLLLVTFFLHVIAMNLLLGGGLAGALSGTRGRANVPHHRRLSEQIFRALPVASAATVTLGVAPLLFLQVLYGRFFYTSSILIAVPWFAVIGLLCLAYYGHYFMALSDTVRRERFLWVAWVASLFVAAIAFIYVNNMTLMLDPGRFKALYASGRSGLRLNLAEPTLIPRSLHFLVGALAVTGLAVTALGQRIHRREDGPFGPWAIRYGRNWFAVATLIQIMIGVWFLFSQPPAVRNVFLGGDPVRTAHLFGGIFLALIALALMLVKPESGKVLALSAGLVALTLLAMILVRSWVRDLAIGRLADLGSAAVRTPWDVLAVFLIFFVAALGTVGWMIRRYLVEGRRPAN
jgi:hypothetical protein